MSINDSIQARIKVKAYKNEENPDDRVSLCGEPPQVCPKTGREFFEIPAHTAEVLKVTLPSYEFSDEYEVGNGDKVLPPKQRGGRRKV